LFFFLRLPESKPHGPKCIYVLRYLYVLVLKHVLLGTSLSLPHSTAAIPGNPFKSRLFSLRRRPHPITVVIGSPYFSPRKICGPWHLPANLIHRTLSAISPHTTRSRLRDRRGSSFVRTSPPHTAAALQLSFAISCAFLTIDIHLLAVFRPSPSTRNLHCHHPGQPFSTDPCTRLLFQKKVTGCSFPVHSSALTPHKTTTTKAT
jgi:hypothetical protein